MWRVANGLDNAELDAIHLDEPTFKSWTSYPTQYIVIQIVHIAIQNGELIALKLLFWVFQIKILRNKKTKNS
jgi:hypothetical protein